MVIITYTWGSLFSFLRHDNIMFQFVRLFSRPYRILQLFIWNKPMYVYERAGTTVGCMLITLSNNPAPTAASSPRGSAPLLMETNSAGSAWGRGVSKHPLSSYEKHWHSTETLQTQFDWVQEEAVIYICASAFEYCLVFVFLVLIFLHDYLLKQSH